MQLCTFTRGLVGPHGSPWDSTKLPSRMSYDALFTPELNLHPHGSGAATRPRGNTETPQGIAQAGMKTRLQKLELELISDL